MKTTKFLCALAAILVCTTVFAQKGSRSSSKSSSSSSKSTHTTGRYAGGEGGSSHKGGKYKNPSTNDHYNKRKS
jgi:hypothetical protein